jgi:16S rRNA (guanine527-N7)-methyltransferase
VIGAFKIAWPEAEVTLLESSERKYRFLNLAAARTGLKGLRVLKKRAGHDRLAGREAGFDAVLARALAPLPEAVRICLPLVSEGGIFVCYQSDPPALDERLMKALAAASSRLVESYPYLLPLEETARHLAVFERGDQTCRC